MSPSMLLGRGAIPAIALLLAAALAWQWMERLAIKASPVRARGVVAALDRPPDDDESAVVRAIAEGRVVARPGAEVTVSAEVLGTIVNMPVRENMLVHKGDLLAEFRADDLRASMREAHSRLTEAEAGLRLERAREQLDQILPVLLGQSRSPETTRDVIKGATARRDAAQAVVERLEAEAAKYRLLAPIDGTIIARHAAAGETLAPAAALVTIADLGRLQVEAEIDEFDIPRIELRAPVAISAEGHRGRTWRGEVEEIAAAVVARRTRPADPARPADARVLLVKIAFRERNPLKLGQRVEVKIQAPEGDTPPPRP